MMSILTDPVFAGFLSASVRLSMPILLAALGGVFAERSGVLNVGLEGMMLAGCFAGFMLTFLSGQLSVGLAAAMVVGGLVGLLLGCFAITLRANQVVVGIAINLLVAGTTAFLFRLAFRAGAETPRITPFKPLDFGPLADIPVLGPLLFSHDILTYAALGLVLLSWVVLCRSTIGLTVSAVGEHPVAATTLGLYVIRTRYLAVMASGVLAGLGGAFLSISATGLFLDNMTAGRGYIALAILILGRRHPVGIVAASLLFGAAEALQLRAQLMPTGVPLQALIVLPYALTLVVLAGFASRSGAPASLGQPLPRTGIR
ncbi:ABC transporter permease [Tropicimonas sediminicola]|uniref:Nucleoside ABC transporter membrane protein n=1 Tax=Tropicimonas sediminicola TaxID=1031541 RepID=A0A239DHM1_9RHOB|nr:ABC transporter permease [Tropicimonas sediminicola]SNS31421.1 nucleoside ABC transporter membrane protein [Tropicimonas sediminicola]